MTITRDIDDLTTAPGGKSGAEWTGDARQSLKALWQLSGGMVAVTGVNVLTASLDVPNGFTSYGNGLRCTFKPAASNTGAVTINIGGIGAKAIRSAEGVVLAAGAIIANRVTDIVFDAANDYFRLLGSSGNTNVTVQGGIVLQRSLVSRLAAPAGPATALTPVASQAFQCLLANSRVIIEGNVGRVTGAGSSDPAGVVIALYVDNVLKQSFTDHCQPSGQVNTPFSFTYLPGDISAHTYEIRVSSTIAATYPKDVNAMSCQEMSPNA